VRERLTSLEARLLAYLAERAGQAVSRDELLVQVWEYAPGVVTRALDTTVRRLRRKIERDPSTPEHVLVEHGFGYRFVPPRAAPPRAFVVADRVERPQVQAQVVEALDEHRLVTLWGPGGIGKTTLAEVVLAQRVGVRVELAGVQREATLLARLGEALDLGGEPDVRALGQALSVPGRVLLIDEAEHLVEALAGLLGQVLDGPDGTAVLVTSRVPLGLAVERVIPVPALTHEQAVELYRLHCERIGAEAAESGAIAALVEALDRLPLALTLAAGRGLVASPAPQLERLRQGQVSDPSERIQHSVAHHLSLLSPQQRQTACALTVFGGWFTASDVADVLGEPAARVLPDLVRVSLVQRAQAGWLRILSVVRSALRQVQPPDASVVDAHQAWLVERIVALDREVHGPDPGPALNAGARLLPDLLSTWDQARDRGDGERIGRLAVASAALMEARSPLSLRRRLYRECLALGPAVPLDQRLFVQARLALSLARYDADPTGQALAGQALDQARQADPAVRAEVRVMHARVLRSLGDSDRAEHGLREALRTLSTLDPLSVTWGLGHARGQLGLTIYLRDPSRADEALDHLRAGLKQVSRRHPRLAAGMHNDVARILLETGQPGARGALAAGAREAERAADRRLEAGLRANLGLVLLDDAPEQARPELERALELLTPLGQPFITALVRGNLAWLHLFAGRPAQAAALAQAAAEAHRRPWYRVAFLCQAALALHRAGQTPRARDVLVDVQGALPMLDERVDSAQYIHDLVASACVPDQVRPADRPIGDPQVRLLVDRFVRGITPPASDPP